MFGTFALVLGHWPDELISDKPSSTACHERLRRALLDALKTPGKVGPGDLAGLISHVLRRQAVLEAKETRLKVPKLPSWPDEAMWRAFGLDVALQGPQWFQIRSQPWHPDWLNETTDRPPLDDAFAERQRRPNVSVQADPFLPMELGTKFSRYTCPGQRMAVRTAILAKEGAVIIVNLPTGAGKSLVAWALGMAGQSTPGLTLVVVPTVALALDQERQVAHLFRGQLVAGVPLAWHSALPDEERKAIRSNIRQGSQTILFASPESVVSSLAPALYKAARKGLLRSLIIDEAHLVSQWGAEFRPEFQAMAGLAADLRKYCPNGARFKTLLMTATLTSEAYLALKTLYYPGEEPLLVSEARLRPEPAYFVKRVASESEREARVMELICRLPRPFILYVTRPEDTAPWIHRIQNLGIRRVATLHGKSKAEDRIRVVDAWRSSDLDAIVATSAFGLGMDKSDVRAVLHACVPETVDRFYQEVGRGGRDGKACISFVIFTSSDLRMAKRINRKRIISIEKGLTRWLAMFARAEVIDSEADLLRVDLCARPPHVRQDSDENEAWNLRTLVLMARAGLISLESEPPPQVEPTMDRPELTDETVWSTASQKYFTSRVVRVMAGHLDEGAWRVRAEKVRDQINQADLKSFELMEKVLQGKHEVSDALCEIYRIPEAGVEVSPGCGGCPVCRRQGNNETAATVGYMAPPTLSLPDVDPVLRQALGKNTYFLPVTYARHGTSRQEKRSWRRLIFRTLKRLISLGIMEVAADDSWLEEQDYRELYLTSPSRFLLHTSLQESSSISGELALARVTLLNPETATGATIPPEVLMAERPLHLVIVPENIRSLCRAQRRLVDINSHCTINNLLERLE